jgi:ABC-type glycerol-3-phosphate transport system permease component
MIAHNLINNVTYLRHLLFTSTPVGSAPLSKDGAGAPSGEKSAKVSNVNKPPAAFGAQIRRLIENVLLYGFLIFISLFMIVPFVWMLSTSLKPPDEIFAKPPIIISQNFTLNAYNFLINGGILRNVANSLIIALAATLISLFFCSLGGYGFAKFKFPGKGAMFAFLLGTMIIPFTIIMVPLFVIMRDLKWIDTFWPMIIPGAANAFGIFFMRQYISTISMELLDAARIDGASEFAIYWRVILPIIRPGLTSLGMIFFMSSWNNYLWPLVILKSPQNFTLPLVIRSTIGPAGRTVWDVQMAASVISIIPLLIIFLVFQRRFVEGITAGAIKS